MAILDVGRPHVTAYLIRSLGVLVFCYDRMDLCAWFRLLKSKLKIKIFSSLHLPDWMGPTASTKTFLWVFDSSPPQLD